MADVLAEPSPPASRGLALRASLRDLTADRQLVAAVAIPTLLGLVLGAWNLGGHPLWYDETFEALMVMTAPIKFAWWIVTFETSGATYHSILWLWKFVGTNEAALRFPSLVFAVAAIPLVFLIARRAMSVPWAGVAAGLLAISPLWVQEAQEARPYGLFLLGATASTLALLRAVEAPSRARWLVYAALTILTVWTHLMVAWVVIGHAIALLLHPEVRRWWRPAALAIFAAGLAAIPIAISIMLANQARWTWITDATLDSLWNGLRHLASDAGFLMTLLWVALALTGVGMVLYRWRLDRRAAWPMVPIVLWLVLPIVVPWVLSFVRPMYTPRYILPSLAAAVILVTLGLSTIRPRVVALALAAVLCAHSAQGVVAWHTRQHFPDFRAAVRLVVDQGTPADGLAYFYRGPFEPGALYEYRYYLTQTAGSDDRPTMIELAPTAAPFSERVEQALAGYQRLWFIGFGLAEESKKQGLAEIDRHYDLAERYPVFGLDVRRYERRV